MTQGRHPRSKIVAVQRTHNRPFRWQQIPGVIAVASGENSRHPTAGPCPFDFADVPVIDGVTQSTDHGRGYEIVGHLRFVRAEAHSTPAEARFFNSIDPMR